MCIRLTKWSDAKALDLAQSACELATHEKELLLADVAECEPRYEKTVPAFGSYYHARAKLVGVQSTAQLSS